MVADGMSPELATHFARSSGAVAHFGARLARNGSCFVGKDEFGIAKWWFETSIRLWQCCEPGSMVGCESNAIRTHLEQHPRTGANVLCLMNVRETGRPGRPEQGSERCTKPWLGASCSA